MKKQLFQNKLIVKRSPMHGYGVFANKTIKKGEIIEECYIIISKGGDKTLDDFYFDIKGKYKYGIFTGFGIIYNHSDKPNADYRINVRKRLVTIKAIKTIPKGSEIFITYGDEWFSSRGLKPKSPEKINKAKTTKTKSAKQSKRVKKATKKATKKAKR